MKYIAVQDQSLLFSDTNTPQITDQQCLIKVKAIGINRADILQKLGKYPPPKGESPILGIEVAGEIVRCGQQVQDWQVGDRVFSIVAGGGYAEYVAVNANHLIKTPENYTDSEAAACAETFLTAFQSLFFIAQLTSKDKLLVHAGASGVGSAAIQLAKAIGCYVVTTVGSNEKKANCLSLGADVAINYQQEDFVAWSKKNLPHGFDVILDVVAGPYVNKNIDVAALDANIIMLSILGGRYSEGIDVAKMLLKRLAIQASTLRNRSDSYKTELIKAFIEQFYPLLAAKKITPLIDHVYPWQQVEDAHQRMENNENSGKLVLIVPN